MVEKVPIRIRLKTSYSVLHGDSPLLPLANSVVTNLIQSDSFQIIFPSRQIEEGKNEAMNLKQSSISAATKLVIEIFSISSTSC